VGALAEVDWPRGQQDAGSGGNIDHGREAEARTARNTAVSWAASSMVETTRTTAPASLTSITGAADVAARGTGAAAMASLTIGTKSGVTDFAGLAGVVVVAWRAARRQLKTCCEQTCQRRATSDTRLPEPGFPRQSAPSPPPTNGGGDQVPSGSRPADRHSLRRH
jgi:hypothetical protein